MKKRDLRHINLYEDKKGQTILYDPKKKEGYIVPSDDVGKLAALQYRWYVVLAVGILAHLLFNLKWWLSLAIVVVVFILGEYTYRIGMLKKYDRIQNYTPANILDKSIEAYKQDKKAMLSRIALYSALGALAFLSTQGQSIKMVETQIMYLVGAFALLNAGYHLYIYLKRNK